MFFHLTTHSAYSLQEGLLSPSELVQAANTQGMPALGLTDHRLLTGSVEFVQACQEAGIQPILGLEIDLDTGKLALLATSMEGWSNLCRLSSALALHDNPEATCSLEFLEPYSKDLIALSGTQGDNSGQRLGNLKDVFNNRLYLTLQDPSVGLLLSSISRRMKVPMVSIFMRVGDEDVEHAVLDPQRI